MLAAAAAALFLADRFDAVTLFYFSLLSLVLTLGLALWLVIINTYDFGLDVISVDYLGRK
jgi:hypothetical protein